MDLPFGLAAGLGDGGEETFAVRVVAEDFRGAIRATDDVIDRTGIFKAQLPRHESKRVLTSRTVNSENLQRRQLLLFHDALQEPGGKQTTIPIWLSFNCRKTRHRLDLIRANFSGLLIW